MSDAVKTTLPEGGDLVDFDHVIQGHVGPSTKQVFHVERARVLRNQKLSLHAREFIVKDQFTNLYTVFTSKLMDDEVYAVVTWIKPSMLKKWGGFTDPMLDYLQTDAFVAFGRAQLAILKGRSAAGLPMVGGHLVGKTIALTS